MTNSSEHYPPPPDRRPSSPPPGPGHPMSPGPSQSAWRPPAPPPRRRHPLVVVAIALAGLLLVGAGAAATWFLVREPEKGADSPELAVQSFLRAVYREQDPAAAAALVCSQARDEESLATKVEEIRDDQETEAEPRFQWSAPEVVEQTDQAATVEITVTMITRDERVAHQHLRVSVLDGGDRGWWVCDVAVVEDTDQDSAPADDAESADDAGEERSSEENGE